MFLGVYLYKSFVMKNRIKKVVNSLQDLSAHICNCNCHAAFGKPDIINKCCKCLVCPICNKHIYTVFKWRHRILCKVNAFIEMQKVSKERFRKRASKK